MATIEKTIWCIMGMLEKQIYLNLSSKKRKWAQGLAEKHFNLEWRKLYNKGYRCRKAKLIINIE